MLKPEMVSIVQRANAVHITFGLLLIVRTNFNELLRESVIDLKCANVNSYQLVV